MKNAEIASIFERMADVLELKGENPFRINSYRRAARVIGDLTQDIKEIAGEGKLKDIPDIGEGHAEKIEEFLKTGRMSKYEEVMEGVSPETVAMMHIPGLGPKTVAMLNKELGIVGIAQLEEAIKQGHIQTNIRIDLGEELVAEDRGKSLTGYDPKSALGKYQVANQGRQNQTE